MEIFFYFMSGLTLGIAMTYTYYDAKARRERMDAMFAKIKVMDNNSNNNSNSNNNESIQ
jgi:hypothetical protein